MPVQIKKSRALESINLTPMVDVVFFLLTFFMMATQFSQDSDRELPVKLPSAASAVPMTMEPNELVINIEANGDYTVLSQRMTLERIETVVSQAVTDNPINQVVIIRGDRQVPFQAVVTIMDLCNRLKVPSYKVTAETDEGS